MSEYMNFLNLLDEFEKFTEKRAMQTDFEGEHEWDSAEFRESKRDTRNELKKNYAALLERAEKAEALDEIEMGRKWTRAAYPPLLRDNKPVLVYTKSGEFYSGLYVGNNSWTGLDRDFREGEVTHWMPLPEPPEDK